MSDSDIKVEDEHKDIHEDGGDDEVRAGTIIQSRASEAHQSLSPENASKIYIYAILTSRHVGGDIRDEEKSSGNGG